MPEQADQEGINQFGEKLRAIRKAKGLSMQELANKAEIELSQIARIETGKINTKLTTILLLARTLEIHTRDLFDF